MESKNMGTLKSMTCTFLFFGTETQLGGYPGLNRAGSEQATGVLSHGCAFPSVNEAQRLVDLLLWAAVKSHTVKVWGRRDMNERGPSSPSLNCMV